MPAAHSNARFVMIAKKVGSYPHAQKFAQPNRLSLVDLMICAPAQHSVSKSCANTVMKTPKFTIQRRQAYAALTRFS
jgi:hypothetical protein